MSPSPPPSTAAHPAARHPAARHAVRSLFFVSGALFATWGVQVPAVKVLVALAVVVQVAVALVVAVAVLAEVLVLEARVAVLEVLVLQAQDNCNHTIGYNKLLKPQTLGL